MRLLAFLFACAVTCSQATHAQQEPILIRFSHVVASDAPKGKAAERFRRVRSVSDHADKPGPTPTTAFAQTACFLGPD